MTIDELSDQYQLPNTKGDMLYLISMVMQYSELMRKCFPNEILNARKKIKNMKPAPTVYGILSDTKAINKALITFKDSKTKLKRQGLM